MKLLAFIFTLILVPHITVSKTNTTTDSSIQVPNQYISFNNELIPKICFSPKQNCEVPLTKFIQTANKSIDMAIYSITLKYFSDLLVQQAAHKQIRLIVDFNQSKYPTSKVKTLVSRGLAIPFQEWEEMQN
ncbi:MAG: hypothetical protein H6625_03360 [Bdellovibrionaceae bacterium]|nr:hypothetical protein [Pseudobdellovibrionaceae bacterium]